MPVSGLRRRRHNLGIESLEHRALLANANFAVIGDFGKNSAGEQAVADLVLGRNPDFIVTVGDNNYSTDPNSYDPYVGQYYHSYIAPYTGAYGAGSPVGNRFWPAVGNHDWDVANLTSYLNFFQLPGNERYYTITKGPVQFFFLDSDSREPDGRNSTSTQANWLQSQLAASSAAWKVVIIHHPAQISTGNVTAVMQWPYKAWGASVVLQGHVHIYDRVEVDGLTYITSGDGNGGGAVFVEASDTLITFRHTTPSGTVDDTFSMTGPGGGGGGPIVDLTPVDVSVSEPGANTGSLSVSRSGATTDPLTVNYSIGGSATNGTDYATLSGSVTIGAGQASALIPINPINDPDVEGDETITISLSSSLSYGLGTSTSVTLNLVDDELGLVRRVIASSDDAEESPSGSVSISGGDLELVDDGGLQTVGVRFTNIAIPAGMSVTNAYIQFEANETQSTATNLLVQGQAIDNSPTFTSASNNVSSRARTAASVNWAPPAWTNVGDHGVDQRTPNLVGILGEILNRPGWTSGNSLSFIVTGTGHRTAESFDSTPSGAPLLHLDFVPNTAPTTSGIAGVSASENGPPTVVNLFPSFADAQTPDANLIYTITGNTNPGLFASTPINSGLGTLTLNYAANAHGIGNITVRATDAGVPGLFVETTFQVIVAEPNTPPTAPGLLPVDVAEDAPNVVINLRDVFQDAETPDANLTFALLSSPDPSIYTSVTLNAGILTLDFAPNADGVGDLTIRCTDAGTVPLFLDATLLVTLTEVNDAPVRTAGTLNNLTIAESAPATSLGLGALAYGPGGGADETGQTLSYAVTAVPAPTLGDIVLSNGTTVVAPGPYSLAQIQGMKFRPVAGNTGGPEAFTFTVTDNGTTAGVADPRQIVQSLNITVNQPPVVLERRIAAGSDDAEQNGTSVSLTGGDLELVFDGSNQTVGLRFTNITIPRGTTISNAYIQFQADEAQSEVTNLLIQGHAIDDAPTFTATTNGVSSLPRTTASAAWSPAAWTTVGDHGTAQQTSNLAAVLNELVSRPGWASGNDVALIVTGTGHRTAETFEGLAAAAALLHIEYLTGPNTPPTTSGLANVTVVEDAPNTVVNLHAAFADSQTPDASLVYTITGNTNPSLLASTAINGPAGTLTLGYAANAVGSTTLTVRATDAGVPPMFVETSFTVTTTSVNDAPIRTAGTVANLNVLENAAATSLGLSGIAYGPGGGGDEAAQMLTYAVTAVPLAAFGDVLLTDGTTVVAPGAFSLAAIQGMKFRPAAGVTSGTATFTFTVTDDGTTNGSFDPKVLSQSLTLSVGPIVVAPTIIERRIAAGSDDAEQKGTSVSLTGGDMELVFDGSNQTVGMRFVNITIPQGATVSNAYIQFQADEAQSEVTNLLFQGHAIDDAPTFTSATNGISSLPRTTASANWSPAPWVAVGDHGAAQQTSNLAAILNELVSRPGWVSGNDVAFVVTGTGHRTAETFEGLAAAAALLHLEFATGPNTPPTTSGLANVTVAEDAPNTVVNLHAAFADAQTPDASLVYTITGNTNPALFASTAINGPAGTLTLGYAANLFGTSTITVRATDTGAPNLFVEAPFTVTVTSVNDAPTRTAGTVANLSVVANAAATSLGLSAIAYGPGGGGDEAGQSLSYAVTAVPSAALGNILLADGTTVVAAGPYTLAEIQGMKFRPATGVTSGAGTFTFTATDNGTTNGSPDPQVLSQSLTVSIGPNGGSLDVRINVGSDDAEQLVGSGTTLGSSDLDLVIDGTAQFVGLRFPNVAIPVGATVTNAYVQFMVDEVTTAAASFIVRGQDADNSPTFVNVVNNISSRPTTAASVTWNPATWTAIGLAGVDQRTPNLASVVQPIVSRPGWASGNALVIILSGTGSRVAESFEGLPAGAPLLHVDYTFGGPLMAEGPARAGGDRAPLTLHGASALQTAALDRLALAWGRSAVQGLADVQLRIDDLPGQMVGLAAGRTITLDRDAAGHGWFLDSTPYDDAEFLGGARPAGIDLLTTLMHEYGHLIGHEHDDGSSLMGSSLPDGVRRLPEGGGDASAHDKLFSLLGDDCL